MKTAKDIAAKIDIAERDHARDRSIVCIVAEMCDGSLKLFCEVMELLASSEYKYTVDYVQDSLPESEWIWDGAFMYEPGMSFKDVGSFMFVGNDGPSGGTGKSRSREIRVTDRVRFM